MVLFLPEQTFPLNLQVNKKNLCILLQCDNFVRKHMRTTRGPGDRGGGQALRIFALPCSREVSTI